MKILGAILICASCTIIGLRISNTERTRYRALCGISFALDFMIAEISCLLSPIKVIFEKLSLQSPVPINRFFCDCLLRLETEETCTITQIWRETAETATYLCLRDRELQSLQEIGTVLGRYSAAEQVQLLKGIQLQVESLKDTAKEEKARNGRVYRSLGITCGIALVILLI